MNPSSEQPRSYRDLWTFLGLVFALSIVFYALIVQAGGLEKNQILVLGLMWSPGISAIITQLIYHRSLRGLGWRPGKIIYLLVAYFLPLGYALVAYGLVWLAGWGGYNREAMSPVQMLVMATAGVLMSVFSGLGEEIGWRGFLVPRLAKRFSFIPLALISGGIWTLWHSPLILFADYRSAGTPVWYSLICFTLLVLGISFPFAWLRLRSGSLWPAALLHASHNLFIQGIFDVVTVNTGPTPYLTGEFGAALALMGVLVAILFIWLEKRRS